MPGHLAKIIKRFNVIIKMPTYSPVALYERPVDVVLILAWNYAAPIMAKHPKFHGNFVVPLPEVSLA